MWLIILCLGTFHFVEISDIVATLSADLLAFNLR